MPQKISSQELLFKKYVENTTLKSIVFLAKSFLSNLSRKVFRVLSSIHLLDNPKVLVSTKVLKHIYDDHKAQHVTIIKNLHRIVRLPDAVYKNKSEKEGNYLFIKDIKKKTYCVVLDVIQINGAVTCEVRTGFYTSRPKHYLKNNVLIWKSDTHK